MEVLYIFSSIFLMGILSSAGNADITEDKQALLDFINSLPHSRPLNWNKDSSVCNNWTGITCNDDSSRVIELRLPGVGFEGPIPANTLSRLSALQILSLRSNGINGHFPLDFINLRNLSLLYLNYNNLSGPLPLDFSVWKNLTIVNLSHNAFNGVLPNSISNLTQLTALNLANNLLSGEIPDLNFLKLQYLNLSDNNFIGIVPKSLAKFPSSVFVGNNVSFIHYSPILPPAKPQTHQKKLKEITLIEIVGIACVLGLVGFTFFLIFCRLKRKNEDRFVGKSKKGDVSPGKGILGSGDINNKLVFFEGCNYAFDLEDLLRASAEVLGKGTFGMSYKATLEDANLVVVKRLKEASVGRREFEQNMEMIGSIKHPNVVELRAYFYSKDEKLMVYDYNGQGSVAALLHDNRGEGDQRIPLHWNIRLKIAIGTARGISRIHTEYTVKLVHGNVKSSNIFLNSQQYGTLSDTGLTTIMSSLGPHTSRAAGYRAPEVTDTRKSQQPSDVYSFGVVLLELLTGKSPVHTTGNDEVVHLVRWVRSVVREEWTAEVFDVELMRYANIEEELVEMLQIAMACVVRIPDQRPKIVDVVKMVENIKRIDSGTSRSSEFSA